MEANIALAIFRYDVFVFPDGDHLFEQELPGKTLLFQKIGTNRAVPIEEERFERMIATGQAVRKEAASVEGGRKVTRPWEVLPPDIAPHELNRMKSFQHYLRKLDADPFVGRSKAGAERLIAQERPEALALGLTHNVGPDRLLHYARTAGQPGNRMLMFFWDKRGEHSKTTLDPEIDRLLDYAVDFFYDHRDRTYTDTVAEFDLKLLELNKRLVGYGREPMSIKDRHSTVQRRIKAAECYQTIERKWGSFVADRRYKGTAQHIKATKPGELVIIDHTLLDVCLFDSRTGLPLGRAWLTLAIDVYSRAVLAYFISPEPPSLYTTLHVIKLINLPKHGYADRHPEFQLTTDSWCRPVTILVDNGCDFLSPSFQQALLDLGIEIFRSPIATPQFKSIVERAFGTFNTRFFKRVPGAFILTLADRKRLDLDKEVRRGLTLEQLDPMMFEAVCIYEHEWHEGVEGRPAQLWKAGLVKNPRQFISNINDLDTIAGATGREPLSVRGVHFEKMYFHDQDAVTQILDSMARFAPSRKLKIDAPRRVNVSFKYNPADCSKIMVYVEVGGQWQYMPLYNKHPNASRDMSFWQMAKLISFATTLGYSTENEEQLLRAKVKLRQLYEAKVELQSDLRNAQRMAGSAPPKLSGGPTLELTANDPNAMAIEPAERLDRDEPIFPSKRRAEKAKKTLVRNNAVRARLADAQRPEDSLVRPERADWSAIDTDFSAMKAGKA